MIDVGGIEEEDAVDLTAYGIEDAGSLLSTDTKRKLGEDVYAKMIGRVKKKKDSEKKKATKEKEQKKADEEKIANSKPEELFFWGGAKVGYGAGE